MGNWSQISSDAFNTIQVDAGTLVTEFSTTTPTINKTKILCATTGGITISCVPTFSDFGEDIDNCPLNTKEMKHLDSWECTFSTTAIGVTADTIKFALGAAVKTGATVKPLSAVTTDHFTNELWWVGDKTDGGLVAVKLINALSTGGFSLQTSKNAKGQLSLTVTGHVTMANPDIVPMEFYVGTA